MGSQLSEAQLSALYGAMSKHPDLGASAEARPIMSWVPLLDLFSWHPEISQDFQATFASASGLGFELFARELLGQPRW